MQVLDLGVGLGEVLDGVRYQLLLLLLARGRLIRQLKQTVVYFTASKIRSLILFISIRIRTVNFQIDTMKIMDSNYLTIKNQ